MTVTSPNNRTPYVGSGNTGPFDIGFDVSSASSFSVTRVIIATGAETTLTLNAGTNGYTVNTNLTQFTLTESIDSSKRLVVLLKEPLTQNDSYLANNTFPSKTVENELDKLTRINLQQQEQIDRSLKFAAGSPNSNAQLPNPNTGKALLWDSNGDLINSADDFNTIVTSAAASASAAATSASSASSSASAASTSASTASTQAGIATAKAVLTAADVVSTHADVVSTAANAATATTQASAASTSATAASTSASGAATSATNAATSATNAATSATSASTSATNASTSATSAAASVAAIPSIKYTYKTSTTMADPSSANIRLNNATIASVTAIAVSANSADSGNPDVSDFIAVWGASTNTNKGTITLRKASSPGTFATFTVTAAVTDNSSWLQLTVTYVAGSGTLSADDSIYLGFARAGDKGTDGAGSGDFSTNTSTSVDSEIVLFSGTAAKTGKRATGSGLALLTSGVLSTTSPTSAGVMIGNGSSAPTTVAPGTSGNVLTSNGSAWASTAASSGALTLLTTLTASSSASLIADNTIITGTYTNYFVVFQNVKPATDNVNFRVRFSVDNGSTVLSSGYVNSLVGYINAGGTISVDDGGSDSAYIAVGFGHLGNDTAESLNGNLYLNNLRSAVNHKSMTCQVVFDNPSGVPVNSSTAATNSTTSAVNYLQFSMSSGNIASGTIKIYGVS